jgi:tRNA (cytosine49-C5)-methyltransferase
VSRLSPEAKLAAKRELLIERTAKALRVDENTAADMLRIVRRQSLRMNPLSGQSQSETLDGLRQVGWEGRAYDWFSGGLMIDEGLTAIRDSQLFADGHVYIQNAASWLPVLALVPQPGEKILDVCAAPGGKTTHIAAAAQNHAIITANDNSRTRLARLQANCRRMQAQIDRFTLFEARNLTRKLPGEQFDKILLDAPCSGEGMMHLDSDKDFQTWSLAQIKRLQSLQKSMLRQAWQLLRVGGTLVYSTCTMAPEENEAVVDYLVRTCDDARIQEIRIAVPNKTQIVTEWNGKTFTPELKKCLRLKPSSNIEAFFVTRFTKLADS